MKVQRITRIRICTSTTDWRGNTVEPQLELIDDEGDIAASLPLSELAEALAPYLTVKVKETT